MGAVIEGRGSQPCGGVESTGVVYDVDVVSVALR
jgi:hypothetical protein